MLTTCWSAKGGSGVTTVVVSLAVTARVEGRAPLLVDLAGDVAAVLGRPDPAGPDLGDWLASPADVGPEALLRLTVPVDGIDLLTCNRVPSSSTPERHQHFCDWLRALDRPVLVDVGSNHDDLAGLLVDCADRSLLVTRLCYLSLRRAIASPRAASGVVVVHERQRTLTRRDVEVALDLPVVASIEVTPAMANVIDAGMLQHRMPTYVRRALRGVA